MIRDMLNGKSINSSFIICYFQYALLFKRLSGEYKEKYEVYVNKKINLIKKNDYQVNKEVIPDIYDFFMLIYLSNKDISTPEMQKMQKVLIEEHLIRQMYWMFHGPEFKETMKSKVISSSLKMKDEVYLEKFQKDPYFKMKYLDIFIKELHNQDIYHHMFSLTIDSEASTFPHEVAGGAKLSLADFLAQYGKFGSRFIRHQVTITDTAVENWIDIESGVVVVE